MKKLNILITVLLVFSVSLSLTSCIVMTKHDNGLHKGWQKNAKKSNSSSKPGRGKH